MMTWFDQFDKMLQGHGPDEALQLKGAGSADLDFVLAHVRYQFESKVLAAVEETYPKTIALIGEDKFKETWEAFQRSNPSSPRSLDHYPGVFLAYFLSTDAPLSLKELMRFEDIIDRYPWTHPRLERIDLPALALTETLVIEIPPMDVFSFEAPAMALYQGKEVFNDEEAEEVLFYFLEDGLRFRRLQPWERQVLEHLSEGLGEALAYAPEDAQAVGDFFNWLGRSGLIRKVRG